MGKANTFSMLLYIALSARAEGGRAETDTVQKYSCSGCQNAQK